jgi:hypothetical protein
MAVLGVEGTVDLSREWPSPTIVDCNRITGGAIAGLDVTEPGFWSGDRVLVFCERGIPFDSTGDGNPDCPTGYGFYGSDQYVLGPAILSRLKGNGFYGNPATSAIRPFYEVGDRVGLVKQIDAYVHRDAMDNLSFYANELAAINGAGGDALIPLFSVDFGKLVIASYSSNLDYQQFLAGVAADIFNGEISAELDEEPLLDLPADIEEIVNNPDVRGWKRQGDLTDWVFEMDAGQLDQTSVGDIFGEYAKGVLSGSGSFNAIFSNNQIREEAASGDILKFLTLTARGAKAKARFKMDSVFYEADILFFKTQVNTVVDDVIKLSAEFISTGSVRVVAGPERVNC